MRIITMILRIYSILILIALLFINCTRPNQKARTDYDQLYALWHEDIFKDSIARELKPYVNTALTLNNTKQSREKIDKLLGKLRWTRDSISFFKLSKKAVLFSKRASDDNLLASTYNNIGMYYHDIGVLDSTFYYYVKAENVYRSLGDSMKVGEMEFFQARVLYEKGLTMESEVKVANSLKILQDYPLNPVPFEANQLMALCLIEREEYTKGKEYLLKAIDLMLADLGKNKVLDSKYLSYAIAMGYNNLSALEIVLENYQKASIDAQEGLRYLPKNSSEILSGTLKSNKARAEFYSSLTNNREKSESYISIVKQSYEIAKQLKHNYLQYNSAIMVADMYYELNNHKQALDWAKQAYLVATQKQLKVLEKEALGLINVLEKYIKKIGSIFSLNSDVYLFYVTY
ncbi:hypothetical protein [Myroides marinus]|uniref:hypothetical protein n=1 Tax=Myroides marinus TaxID=703342 RepID=UPI00115FA9CC|nr:hypothetical protein [Myroides marinus]